MRDRDIAIMVGVVLVVFIFSMPAMGMMGGGMMMGWDGFNPWWGGLMMLFWILIVGGLVLLAVSLFWSSSDRRDTGENDASRALEILRERYARGELNREEFEQMRRVLES